MEATIVNPLARALPETSKLYDIPRPLPLGGRSCVYFLQRQSDQAIKIGFTGVFHVRKRKIAKDIGEPVTDLAVFYDIHGAYRWSYWERILHRHFNASRIEGEWFAPTDELTNFIDWLVYRGKAVSRVY